MTVENCRFTHGNSLGPIHKLNVDFYPNGIVFAASDSRDKVVVAITMEDAATLLTRLAAHLQVPEVGSKTAELEEAELDISQLEKEIAALKQDVQERDKTISDLKEAVAGLDAAVELYRERYIKLEEKANTLRDDLFLRTSELEECKKLLDETTDNRDELEALLLKRSSQKLASCTEEHLVNLFGYSLDLTALADMNWVTRLIDDFKTALKLDLRVTLSTAPDGEVFGVFLVQESAGTVDRQEARGYIMGYIQAVSPGE